MLLISPKFSCINNNNENISFEDFSNKFYKILNDSSPGTSNKSALTLETLNKLLSSDSYQLDQLDQIDQIDQIDHLDQLIEMELRRRPKNAYKIDDIINLFNNKINKQKTFNENKLKKIHKAIIEQGCLRQVVDTENILNRINQNSNKLIPLNDNLEKEKLLNNLENNLLQDLEYNDDNKNRHFIDLLNKRILPSQRLIDYSSDIICEICNEKETEYQNDIFTCKVLFLLKNNIDM